MMRKQEIIRKIPTSSYLADLRGERRGVKYLRIKGGITKREMLNELSRRKKLGLVRKDAGKGRRTQGFGNFGGAFKSTLNFRPRF
jgi:hypothetical protein